MLKSLLFSTAALLVSTQAFAADPRPQVAVAKNGDTVLIQITGAAARTLFASLDVQARGEFGILQKQIKQTATIYCEQAILGDVPGQMSEPRFTCTITESAR